MRNFFVLERHSWLLLRCLLAFLVSVHGWTRWNADGFLPFAHRMDQIIPFGYYLVLILQFMEMGGSVVLATGRFVSAISLVFSIIYSCSIYFYHSRFGWFSNGGEHDGAEYAVSLIVCFLALAWRCWPSPWQRISAHFKSSFSADGEEAGNWRAKWSWLYLQYMLVVLIGIHVLYRAINLKVDEMAALMPNYVPSPQLFAAAVTILQALALAGIVIGYARKHAYAMLVAFNLCAIVFHHAWQGWKVSGTDHDGVEFVLLQTVVLLLCVAQELRHRRRQEGLESEITSDNNREPNREQVGEPVSVQ